MAGRSFIFIFSFGLYYQFLSYGWNFIFAKSAFLGSGYACSPGYVSLREHASAHSPGRAHEVTSRVSNLRWKQAATSLTPVF